MEEQRTALADAIVSARRQAGLTQRELGQRLGVSTSLLAKWEQGNRAPADEWITELDRALGSDLAAVAPKVGRRRGPRPRVARAAAPAVSPAPGAPPAARRGGGPTKDDGTIVVVTGPDAGLVVEAGRLRPARVVDARSWAALPDPERARLVGELVLSAGSTTPDAVAELIRVLAVPAG